MMREFFIGHPLAILGLLPLGLFFAIFVGVVIWSTRILKHEVTTQASQLALLADDKTPVGDNHET